MARRSLRPELNRIRAWVRQGRTDAWIAHQLEVTVQQIQAFKREHGLETEPEAEGKAVLDYDDEIDLRAEDEALIAAELDAAETQLSEEPEEADEPEETAEPEEPADTEEAAETEASEPEEATETPEGEQAEGGAETEEERDRRARRRRGRRGGRRTRRKTPTTLEATFDHGEEGYGLWLDPAVQDDPIYAEYWAGHRPVEVAIEEDQIVIRRAGDEADDGD